MLPPELKIALKEWAVVQRALVENHQILLLRKGGLNEETGHFDLRTRQFLIYPTYEHQAEHLSYLQPQYRDWLDEEVAFRPAEQWIRIDIACEVQEVVKLSSPDGLYALMPQMVFSKEFIDERFSRDPHKTVVALIVQTWMLHDPHVIPVEPEYAGCRSWVDLKNPINTRRKTIVGPSESLRVDRAVRTKIALLRGTNA